MIRTTRTFSILEVSQNTFREIEKLLRDSGYDHVFIGDDDEIVIDMHGIALKKSGEEQ